MKAAVRVAIAAIAIAAVMFESVRTALCYLVAGGLGLITAVILVAPARRR